MTPLEEDANTLLDFGFTYNQAKIYAAVARLHSASVGSISRMARVRREHVYRTLPKLEKMGLIERGLGTPAKIKALPVEEAFSALIKRQQEEANQKVSALMNEARRFTEHFRQNDWRTTSQDDEPEFSLLSEKDAVMSKMSTAIKNAQREIKIVASRRKLARIIFDLADLLKKTMKRGVKIQIVTQGPEDGDNLPRLIEENILPGNSLELKYATELAGQYLIIDGRDAMFATSTEDDPDDASLWTNNISFLTLIQKSFDDLWNASTNWNRFDSRHLCRKTAIARSAATNP
jgi:sugar-specific transcriptional regulator TrmB